MDLSLRCLGWIVVVAGVIAGFGIAFLGLFVQGALIFLRFAHAALCRGLR